MTAETITPAFVLSQALREAGVMLALQAKNPAGKTWRVETALAETIFEEVDELVRLFEGTMPKAEPEVGATIRVDAFGWGDVVTIFDVRLTRRRLTPTGSLELVWVNGLSMPRDGAP